jgi:hypothetical protein
MPIVKYRAVNPHLDPRRTKLEIPGWVGNSDPRADGSHEQPWHCIPFSEYARGGIELCYPHAHEFQVTSSGSDLIFEEIVAGDAPEENTPPPFRRFGEAYYTYQLLLDLKVEEGYAIKTEPHPRFFTDSAGTVPIAVPALIRHWWPMIFFVVFKVPQDGQTHIFRPGEPFMLVTIVPADDKFELIAMPEDEAAERELQSRRIYASRSTLTADSQWVSSTNTVFDGTYRRLAGAAKSSKAK